jgi:molybdopterin adenylyltransferase
MQDFNCLVCLPRGDNNKQKILALKDSVECILIKLFSSCPPLNEVTSLSINKPESQNKKLDNEEKEKKIFTVGTITISDRAYKGEYEKDLSTETLKIYYENNNNSYKLLNQILIPDEESHILNSLEQLVNEGYDLIITSGGTGLTQRDITTKIVRSFIDKEATGIESYILTESLKITKFACLSNPVVGVKGKTLIITLPGSHKAIKENLTILENIISHALNQTSNIKDFH